MLLTKNGTGTGLIVDNEKIAPGLWIVNVFTFRFEYSPLCLIINPKHRRGAFRRTIMKKIVAVAAMLLCISCVMLFAADIMATTTDGKTVVLHDNGRWEYYKEPSPLKSTGGIEGKWSFSEDYFDVLVDQALAQSGLTASDPSYAMYKQMIASSLMASAGDDVASFLISLFSIEITGDTLIMTTEGVDVPYDYTFDKSTRTISLQNPETSEYMVFGSFDEDYTIFTLSGEELVYLVRI